MTEYGTDGELLAQTIARAEKAEALLEEALALLIRWRSPRRWTRTIVHDDTDAFLDRPEVKERLAAKK